MQTNYAGHEAIYRKLKEKAGQPGWDSAAVMPRDLAILDSMFAWPTFPRPPGRLLELGCGAGNITIHLAQQGWEVTGVDIAPTAVDWARENASASSVKASFAVDDVLTLKTCEDAAFDVVLDGHCLHCIIGGDRQRFHATARRVLRPGGALCVRTMCNEVPASLASKFDKATRCLMHDGIASRYIGRANDLIGEVMAAGFDVQHLQVLPAHDADDLDELLLLARLAA